MTPAEHAAIADAVRSAERGTSGEIYCVLARASDGYFFPAAFAVSVAIVLISMLLALALDTGWYTVAPVTFVAAQALAIGSALLLLWLVPSLRILLVPRRLQYRRAHDNALRQFLARNVHITSARTGVLLFVSLAERYAEVVADAGINSRVDQKTWDGVVATLLAEARRGAVADGFVAAVEEVGALLAAHFPPRPQDANELDDHVVEI
jgi:putative membrane protein